MAIMMIMAMIDGKAVCAQMPDVPLNWIAFDAGHSVEAETLPGYVFEISIGNDKGSFRQTIQKPELQINDL